MEIFLNLGFFHSAQRKRLERNFQKAYNTKARFGPEMSIKRVDTDHLEDVTSRRMVFAIVPYWVDVEPGRELPSSLFSFHEILPTAQIDKKELQNHMNLGEAKKSVESLATYLDGDLTCKFFHLKRITNIKKVKKVIRKDFVNIGGGFTMITRAVGHIIKFEHIEPDVLIDFREISFVLRTDNPIEFKMDFRIAIEYRMGRVLDFVEEVSGSCASFHQFADMMRDFYFHPRFILNRLKARQYTIERSTFRVSSLAENTERFSKLAYQIIDFFRLEEILENLEGMRNYMKNVVLNEHNVNFDKTIDKLHRKLLESEPYTTMNFSLEEVIIDNRIKFTIAMENAIKAFDLAKSNFRHFFDICD
ncbi:unnamed protein product [Caenorhabditis bovis]|uniref:Uncharacterized protein n=1 Tax=Caenorhabditis bovis TaxID=2654633 RepID=A0A8S1ECW2_9PELO|nr:unnamed protein product [Caenorhabditis bovis]